MRKLLPALIAVVVMACSTAGSTGGPTAGTSGGPTAGGSSPTALPEPSGTGESPISVAGDPDTGASDKFGLAGGSYKVAWTTTADTAGCYFSLFLATEVNGPSVENDVILLTQAKEYSGTFIFMFVEAGTYVLQEDRSGYSHCKGPWSATLTLQ